jgi:hypothetical protein
MSISGASNTTLANGNPGGDFDGVDDKGQVPFPPELSGSGLQSFAIEFVMQTSSSATGTKLFQTIDGAQILECRMNSDNFNGQVGNFTFFLRDTGNNDLAVSFQTNPNLADGAVHTILINVVDATSSLIELYVDGSQRTADTTRVDDPNNFKQWGFDLAIAAQNSAGSFSSFADVSFGTIRLHGKSISGPTL